MHSPVEEQGLRARRFQARLVAAVARLPAGELRAIIDEVEACARRRKIVYLRPDGVLDTVRILCCPLVLLPEQHAYAHAVSLTLLSALKRLPRLYQDDADVRAALRLPTEEERWLLDGLSRRHRHDPVFARLDALVDWSSPSWQSSLQFVEPNLSGVGGLHLLPAADRVVAEVLLPRLHAGVRMAPLPDIRELLMQELVDHLDALGRPGRHVVLIEPKETTPGPDEQEDLARHFRTRWGLQVSHADPAELRLEGGEVWFGDRVVDVAYRDYAVTDLLPLRARGVDIEPMRHLLLDNRMVSSLTAEIDAKSDFEVFTDPVLLDRHFSPDERDVLTGHVLWTRLVRERRTTLWDGRDIELLPFARDHQGELVLKPNRSYGGFGVVVGRAVDAAAWAHALDEATRVPDAFVLQRRAEVPVHDFPAVDDAGEAQLEPYYDVMGFAPSRYGLAVLGRGSQRQVVNVAQRGGMVPLVLAQHG